MGDSQEGSIECHQKDTIPDLDGLYMDSHICIDSHTKYDEFKI